MPSASGTQQDPPPDPILTPPPLPGPRSPPPAPIRSSLRNVNISAGRGGSCG